MMSLSLRTDHAVLVAEFRGRYSSFAANDCVYPSNWKEGTKIEFEGGITIMRSKLK